jgi:hypothetical protein
MGPLSFILGALRYPFDPSPYWLLRFQLISWGASAPRRPQWVGLEACQMGELYWISNTIPIIAGVWGGWWPPEIKLWFIFLQPRASMRLHTWSWKVVFISKFVLLGQILTKNTQIDKMHVENSQGRHFCQKKQQLRECSTTSHRVCKVDNFFMV